MFDSDVGDKYDECEYEEGDEIFGRGGTSQIPSATSTLEQAHIGRDTIQSNNPWRQMQFSNLPVTSLEKRNLK